MKPTTQDSIAACVDSATLELLAGWRMQDATDDPEAIHAAEKELTEFKKAMNEARAFGASMPPSQSRMRRMPFRSLRAFGRMMA